jgi:pyruvate/2-oxoglutarate dehydrogenase complex dihydrolipoamide acyltransferase (E2) component
MSTVVAVLLMCGGVAAAQDTAPTPPPAPAAAEAAPAPAAPDAPAPAAAPAAPAPAAAPTATQEGSGTVVFFRPSKMIGAMMGFKVRENGVELGKLRNGKYFKLAVAPGMHQYEVHSETKDVLTLEVEAGQTYYVQGTLGMGIMAGRPNLSPSDEAAFEAVKGKLKEVPPLSGDDEGDK